MYSMERGKVLILKQLLLIAVSIIFCFLCNANMISATVSISSIRYFILFAFMMILLSIYVLKLGLLHVYTVFVLVISLYNISYVILSFFVGEDILLSTGGFAINASFNESIVFEYLTILLFFFLFLHLGALCVLSTRSKIPVVNGWSYNEKMEFYGLFLFYFSLLPCLFYYYSYLKQILLAGGYMNKYGISTMDMNLFIRVSDDLLKFGFFVLLASKCKLSKMILPCTIFLLIQFAVSLISGSRVFFISQSLFVLVYFSMRIKIKTVNVITVLLFFIFFSVFVRKLRSTEDYDMESATSISNNSVFNDIIESFVLPQGMSMHTLSLSVYLVDRNDLEPSLRFLVYPLFQRRAGYVEGVSEKDYFFLADRLSSVFIPRVFVGGGGLGSSIIAEFYVYGGLFMVILFSMLYGMLVCYFDLYKYKTNDVFLFFIILLPGLFYVGRAHPLYPLLYSFKLFVFYVLLIKSGVLDNVRLFFKK